MRISGAMLAKATKGKKTNKGKAYLLCVWMKGKRGKRGPGTSEEDWNERERQRTREI